MITIEEKYVTNGGQGRALIRLQEIEEQTEIHPWKYQIWDETNQRRRGQANSEQEARRIYDRIDAV